MAETVIIKAGRNSKTYHRDAGGTPACGVRDGESADGWREWGIEKAKVWKSPCQRPGCYGESVEERPHDTADAWPA